MSAPTTSFAPVRRTGQMADHLTPHPKIAQSQAPGAVLGATGSVGQRFVQLLEHHPWFRLHEVVASERSAGKSYADAADWRLDTTLPIDSANLTVKPLGSELESTLLF